MTIVTIGFRMSSVAPPICFAPVTCAGQTHSDFVVGARFCAAGRD
jgi:hypothetical protein